MSELVTVLMAVYNTPERWLRKAIESILAQTYTNIEFLIVLDCPTDKSPEIVLEYAKRDDRIKILKNETNKGLVKSLNRGLSQAKGKFIARMDSDDIAFPDRIDEQMNYFKEHDFDIIGAKIIKINEDGEQISEPTMACDSAQVNVTLQYENCVPHPTWFVRVEVYHLLSGYRNIKCCEDYDLLLRAKHVGLRIGNYEGALLYYRVNSKGITGTNRLRQFLTALYLQNLYDVIENVTQEQIEDYLLKRVSARQSRNFDKAMNTFVRGIELIKKKKFVMGTGLVFFSLFRSKYIIVKLKNIILFRKTLKQFA